MVDQRKPWKDMSITEKGDIICLFIVLFVIVGVFIGLIVYVGVSSSKKDHGPEIKLVSMDFAATVNNDSTSQYDRDPLRSARWDLLIRVPGEIVGDYMCLQGNLQASFLYKNVALVTSSKQSYNILEPYMPQIFNVSAVATERDLSGAIGKEIMEAIKERNEVRFESRLYLTDCREKTEKGTLNFGCGEATLRFESSSSDQIKATTFGKDPICIISR